MKYILPIALFVTLSGGAWGACTIYTTNPPIAGPCDDTPVFPAAGIKDPLAPPVMIPVQPFGPPASSDTPLMPQSGTLLSIFQTPCCVNFQTKAGTITIDLDNGTVDLRGAKLDDAARAFWDAVAQVGGHPAVKRRSYTLDEIERMRAIVRVQVANDFDCHGKCAHYWEQEEMTELRVNTLVAAGITPEELESRVK